MRVVSLKTHYQTTSKVSFIDLRASDIFPLGFVEETLRTLSLLLPPNDKKTIAWFRREQSRNLNDEFIMVRQLTADLCQ
jgi:hypothetical protein